MQSNYSQDYNDVIAYIDDTLMFEYPTRSQTVDYLLMSIVDNTHCHAYIILESIIGVENMESLHDSLVQRIVTHSEKKPKIDDYPMRTSMFTSILNYATVEAGDNPVASEHILLSIMGKSHDTPCRDMLLSMGVTYDIVNKKSGMEKQYKESSRNDKQPANNDNTIVQRNPNRLPLKSEINSRAVVSNGSLPFINKYTRNLNDEVSSGKFDKLIGKEDILNKIIKVLSRRKKNNVVLVGKPGVGKTSIGYRLAEMIESGNVPEILENKTVIMLDPMSLVSGTHLRGMFEERVEGLFRELRKNPDYILFIDDMQNVVGGRKRENDCDLSDMIGNILSEGDVRVVGTISFKDYRNGIENNTTLSTKLQKIIIEPSSKTESIEILKNNRHYYENFHHVKFSDEVIEHAVRLSKRYITTNSLPDSAIDVIDLTGASISINKRQEGSIRKLRDRMQEFDEKKEKAMNSGDFEALDMIAKEESYIEKQIKDIKTEIDNDESTWVKATTSDVEDTVSSMTGIPVNKLKASDKETILNIASILKKDVIGQDEAINEVAKAIKRSRAGFGDRSKVVASILEIGPSGVGKTILAKKLADNIFGSEDYLVRFDMSEYQDKSSVNKLIGSSTGYVGYENGGLLTEAIKNKPYCVLLFDEIEKADESIYNLFLQLLDDGRLTDNNGTTVNFKNVIVIMTSNAGARQASELANGIGFNTDPDANRRSIIEKNLRKKFSPEFLNRIDKIIHFNHLTDDNLRKIVKLELDRVCDRVKENSVYISYDDKVIEYIFKRAQKDKEYGARPIMRIIQDDISDKVVDNVLSSNRKKNKYSVTVSDNDEIIVKTLKN